MPEHASRVIVIVVAACVVAALAAAGITTRPDHRGWRLIKPSPMHWTALGLCAALSGFMAYIYLFVGSTRPDAEHQMKILFWLIVAFGIGAIAAAFSIGLVRRGVVRWRGSAIAFAGRNGQETRQLADVVRLEYSRFGRAIVSFRDGTTLRLDPYASGAPQLIDKISDMLGHADGESTD